MTRILYIAPLKDFSGYASAARDYVLALNSVGFDVVTRNLRYDSGFYKPSNLESYFNNKPLETPDIIFQHTTPNEMTARPGFFNVGAFCWETDKIPDLWVKHLNEMQLVIVPTTENLQVARRCGVIVPMVEIPYACDVEKYKKEVKPFDFPQISSRFKFLSICQYSKKKGLDPLLKAYLSEFKPQENVALVLKTYFGPNDGEAERNKMLEILGVIKRALRLKSYPPIQLIHEVADFESIERLYASCDCYVLPSRGEGWGVPHFDALGWGLPVIATKGTGPQEFITPECGWLVNSHMSPVVDMPHPHDFLYTAEENWHEPHVNDLRKCMRGAFELHERKKMSFEVENGAWDNMCKAASKRVSDFSHEQVGAVLKVFIESCYKQWKESNVSKSISAN